MLRRWLPEILSGISSKLQSLVHLSNLVKELPKIIPTLELTIIKLKPIILSIVEI